MSDVTDIYKVYEHAPPHLFTGGAYFVTGGIYLKKPLMHASARKRQWLEQLKMRSAEHGWEVVAWTVLSNHYHILVNAPEQGAQNMPIYIGQLHGATSAIWNRQDECKGRKVWWNYFDTCITNETSFYARLNYTHWNAVHHKLATHAIDYPFSSYREYLDAHPELIAVLEDNYPFDTVKVRDDF